MWETVVRVTSGIAPWIAILFSAIAVVVGVRGFLLSRKIQSELKSDEVLITGVLHNPSLSHPDHENCVIQTTIFNKSKRKAYINAVHVFDAKGDEIDIAWSERIDRLGNPQDRAELIGIVDSASLCIRRNDGEAFRSVRVEITHSFNIEPLVLHFEIEPGWQTYFAR
jgi:hypothetical protein